MALKPEQIRHIVEQNTSKPEAVCLQCGKKPPRCSGCGTVLHEVTAPVVDWDAVAYELNEAVMDQLSE